MERRFEGKNAVVAGGAGGIGSAIVRALIREGANVTVGDVDIDELEKMKREFGDAFTGIRTDVTSEEDQQTLVQKAVRVYGSVDSAFNVAGGSHMGLITDGSIEDWDWSINLCLKGTYLGMRYQLQAMKEQSLAEVEQKRNRSIVNISSINALTPMWGDSAYNAAKRGVISLTETAVLENTKYGIRCNCVVPGQIDTKMTRAWRAVPEINREYMRRIPMHRPGRPDEVASAALFLASDEASYITGTYIVVDGGRLCTGYPDIAPFLEQNPELWEV